MASNHVWTTMPGEDGRSVSACGKCGLEVNHRSDRRPSYTAADRIVHGRRVPVRDSLPLCIDGRRAKMPVKHLWASIGDAPPSPTGASCHKVVCTRCSMQVEVIKSAKCIAARSGHKFWRRFRMSDAEDWSREPLPVCISQTDDKFAEHVKARWDETPIKSLAKELGVSIDVIRSRAKLLGLKSKYTAGGSKPWNEHDDRLLAWHLESRGAKVMAQQLGRTYNAIVRRAVALGLVERGCLRGYETLEQASIRTGYDRTTLRRIIKGRSLKAKKPNTHSERIYDNAERSTYSKSEIDRAISEWHQTETLYAGCVRLDVDPHAMKKALARLGVTRPANLRRGAHWRVLTSKLEEAAIIAKKYITPSEYADMMGYSRLSVVRRLVKAGVERAGLRCWRLPREAYDSLIASDPIKPGKDWRRHQRKEDKESGNG